METEAPRGLVRLLAEEPGKEERYAHAAELLATIARAEAAKRDTRQSTPRQTQRS
jgi:hypothetical protein